MFKLISIKQSDKTAKKYDAKFFDAKTNKNKIISFGSKVHRDFTLMNNKKSKFYINDNEQREKIKRNYQKRHGKNLLTDASKTGMSASALSYYILWTEPTISKSIINYKKRFNL
jgi:hypothetical protein